MAENWSHEEVEATVSDYFEMLAMELRGEPYNKAEHNRHLQKLLNNRTKAAVELKHQNISAVLIELGYPYIHTLMDTNLDTISKNFSMKFAKTAFSRQPG
jgi:hypothetical protein